MSGLDADTVVFRFGDFTLDVARGTLTRRGMEVPLRPKSYAVLRHLVERVGQLVSKNELMEAVWGKTVVTDGSLTQCIIDIRRALGDHDQQLLRTVPRRGFILDAAVTRHEDAGANPIPLSPADDRAVVPEPPLDPLSPPRVRAVAVWALLILGVIGAGWRFWSQQAGPAETTGDTPVVFAAAPSSIAVLRFADLSPGRDQAYFADGLAEEILHLLAQTPALRVTARTSSFAFEPGEEDIATIARQLGVAYLLEGSVRRDGDDLRITAQLIDSSNSYHVWSRTYDRKFNNVLELQREIAVDVATAMKVTLAGAHVSSSPERAKAQDLFLLGRYLFHRRAPGDLQTAERHLLQAVEADPTHARAWTALAGTYAARAGDEFQDPSYRLDEQRAALERALEIDPGLAETHVRLGRYYREVGDDAAARASFERAVELAPGDPLVLYGQASRALAMGRLEEAVEFQQRALLVNPLSAIYQANLGRSLIAAGRYEEGLMHLRRARELSNARESTAEIALALILLGRHEEARSEFGRVAPGPGRDQLLVIIGDGEPARAAMSRLEADTSIQGRIRLAEVAALQGRIEDAFGHLDALAQATRPVEEGPGENDILRLIHGSPLHDLLRSEARWATLIYRFRQGVSGRG